MCTIIKKEVEPTISVFLLTLSTTPSTHTLHTITQKFPAQNTNIRLLVATTIMYVPCAVCHATTRTAKMMIPAKTSCPPSWTREYYGYLQSDAVWPDRQRTEYVCVDKDQVSLYGSHANIDAATLYHVRATCTGIQCPPYNANDVLTCTVCTN